jgi:hypothetical protein
LALVALAVGLPGPVHAADAAGPRAEVPLREVLLPNGTRRYAVPMTLGGVAVEAGLDTGSVGLRVLSRATANAQVDATTRHTTYSYTSGTRFKGVVAKATLALGGVSGPVPVDVIQAIDCRPEKPACPAAHADPATFGIQGDGLPGAGFAAIFGINMGEDEVANPLIKLRVTRWIVELPKPGEPGSGKLILNPAADETAGFVMFPIDRALKDTRGGAHDAIDGCLRDLKTQQTVCGAIILDSGAPGIHIVTAEPEKPWTADDPARIVFVKDGKPALAADFIVDRRDQASHLTTEDEPQMRVPHLYAGLMPYFVFDVLYDAERGEVGLKPR